MKEVKSKLQNGFLVTKATKPNADESVVQLVFFKKINKAYSSLHISQSARHNSHPLGEARDRNVPQSGSSRALRLNSHTHNM